MGNEFNVDGLPCARLKKIRREADFITEEYDLFVQDNKLSDVLTAIKELKLIIDEDNGGCYE